MKKQTVGTQATVTTEMMEEILDWAVPNFLTTAMIGFPGVGKTSIYQQSAVRHGMRFVAAHPVVDDPSDYKGIPWVVKNGKDSGATADFVPIGYLRELIETREPLFLLLDDFPQALPAVQTAIMPRGKLSKYGIQFREKQKLKRFYGILDRQFQNYFKKAERQKGNTGENLLAMLERRLDNVVYLLSFAPSRKSARQLILHGHILVNDKKVDIGSYLVKTGDIVRPKSKEITQNIVKANIELVKGRNIPAWIQSRADTLEGVVTQLPAREDISASAQEQLIVELCSK